MGFLLGTNAVIAMLADAGGRVAVRARRRKPSEVAVPAIVLHDLCYGAYKSQQRDLNVARMEGFRLEVLAFEQDDARAAGAIRARLEHAESRLDPTMS